MCLITRVYTDVRSTFSFKCLPESCPRRFHVDEDGDLVVCRSPLAKGITIGMSNKWIHVIDVTQNLLLTRPNPFGGRVYRLEHVNRTSLDMVGMQVWRSALLMGDFILDNRDIFTREQVVLELGSGVGLTGIVAAMCCKEIVFTGKWPMIIIIVVKNDKRYTKKFTFSTEI